MNNQISTTSSEASQKEQNQIILYHPNDTISLEVLLENETVWLTQEMMSDLSVSCCKICNNCFRW